MEATVNGIRIHYRIDGEAGAPWLVLSNSLATNLSLWDDLVLSLSPHFRILRYDQRGHGATDVPTGPYGMDTLIADAIGLVDHLGIDRAHWCGISLGGSTCMGLAQRYRDRADSLVVCSSPCASADEVARQWMDRIRLVEREGMESIVDQTLARWFTPEVLAVQPAYVHAVRRMILDTPVAGFTGCAAALAKHDFRSSISDLRCRALFVVGSADPYLEPMRTMHAEVPESRFFELSNAGHLCNLDCPAIFAGACADFLLADTVGP